MRWLAPDLSVPAGRQPAAPRYDSDPTEIRYQVRRKPAYWLLACAAVARTRHEGTAASWVDTHAERLSDSRVNRGMIGQPAAVSASARQTARHSPFG